MYLCTYIVLEVRTIKEAPAHAFLFSLVCLYYGRCQLNLTCSTWIRLLNLGIKLFMSSYLLFSRNPGWMTLWPEWHFGQRHFGRDILARMTETVWLERQFGQCHFGWWYFGQWHFGQSDTLASDTLARVTLWPEWHFGQFFMLPLAGVLWGTKGWIKIP